MPHVKFEPKLNLKDIWKTPPDFEYTISQKDMSFKFEESYFSHEEKETLFKFAVIEGRLVQHVFISLLDDGDVLLLKLKRNSPVLRTEGIKLLLAIIASYIEDRGAKIVASSLDPYLKDGRFYQKHVFIK